jgi:phosphoribosyl-dephospho-CoA transferase
VQPRVHDLVQLLDGTWAVVRRARASAGIPIGVRGATRSERWASVVDSTQIVRVVTPEEAATFPPPREHCVFTALAQVVGIANGLQLPIGAAGACGYELVTREAALHPQSDLDLVVRAAFDDPRLAGFAAAAQDVGVRLDIEVLFDDSSGAALAELVRGGTVLVKTPDGPLLC